MPEVNKIIQGLRDALAGRFGRVTIVRRVTRTSTSSRPMTPAEEAAFDKAFAETDKAFRAMGDAFNSIKD